ncbi:MAG TPA: hypothetical protein VI548_01770 [Chitinophagaceae bacterium]|nr:hypothetical protein [Chitinophagaceae bacterium]
MKKIFFILLSVVVLAIVAIFIFIPSEIKISSVTSSSVNQLAAQRVLMNDAVWRQWWPGEEKFAYQGTQFSLTKKMLYAFELSIIQRGDTISGLLQLIPVNTDTTRLNWVCTLTAGSNPLYRFIKYLEAIALKKNLDFLLNSLSNFLGKKENIYGFTVKNSIVTDSVLISTRKQFNHYPDEFEIDSLIQKLRSYIRSNNAKEMNYPMLHIRRIDSLHFEAMTAIATDTKLPDTHEFAYKMLLKGGNLLEAEITGGYATIRKAFSEYNNYVRDYNYTSPAIPYELMITDRTKERDTLKWVTRLCYPVF